VTTPRFVVDRVEADYGKNVKDTTHLAMAVHVEAARLLGRDGRLRVAVEMSEDARRISIAGVKRRHPEYDDAQAQHVLVSALYGEELERRSC